MRDYIAAFYSFQRWVCKKFPGQKFRIYRCRSNRGPSEIGPFGKCRCPRLKLGTDKHERQRQRQFLRGHVNRRRCRHLHSSSFSFPIGCRHCRFYIQSGRTLKSSSSSMLLPPACLPSAHTNTSSLVFRFIFFLTTVSPAPLCSIADK